VPVTINYTRTFEDESFPNELRGESKVKESLGRIAKATNVLLMNFGNICLDFFDPIKLTELHATHDKTIPNFDPSNKKEHRMIFN
jgi:glycerol-3-phosphate O-acyltransferase